ncbi:MAG: ABC transporter substrate-binding protein [Granulosicoccus sp.]
MRYLLLLVLTLLSINISALEWEEQRLFKGAAGKQTLRVISSTDISIFAPIIKRFLVSHPELNVEYLVAGSSAIYGIYRQTPEEFDVVVSSAMDLQLKLANDGFALQLTDLNHPDWAQWRQSVFGFTLEPAAIVINRAAFDTLPVPQSRQEMIEVLRANPETFKGRIGTYDVRRSGLGYLLATQDSRSSETYWRLMEIMGGLDARLYCCSADMIEDLAEGKIAISYNVLGSYADARDDLASKIQVVLPSDFPTTMMRTALVSGSSSKPDAAVTFLQFLTASRWSEADATAGASSSALPALNAEARTSQRSVIALDPGLMIFLDTMKRRLFVKAWENAIIQ